MKTIRILWVLVFSMLMASPVVAGSAGSEQVKRNDKSSSVTIHKSTLHVNPFGIKNPGKSRWKGASGPKTGYAKFENHDYAVRAFVKIISDYQIKKKIYTITKTVRRYTNQSYDQTSKYMSHLEKVTGLKRSEEFSIFSNNGSIKNLPLLKLLIKGVAFCETGTKISDQAVENGIKMYEQDYVLNQKEKK